MKQWDFLLSWDDVWTSLKLILDRPGTVLVHDLWYKDRTLSTYSSVNSEVRDAIMARPSLYVRAEDFSKLPAVMSPVGEGTSEVLFMVESKLGGPLIQLCIRGEYRAKGETLIPPSMFSYADEYMNTISGEWEKPSTELKSAFNDIQRRMKQKMVRRKARNGYAWIGENANRMLIDRRATTNFMGLKFARPV
jgi:hypothetical protein